MSRSQSVRVYGDSGMEVAVHGLSHPFLEKLPAQQCVYEVLQDRINLEAEFGTIIRGMAYPYGTYSNDVVDALKHCGIAYSRTTVSTERFDIPTDWLRLPATCHHRNPRLMELAEQFIVPDKKPMLFYLWGHSFEFESDNNWHVIEEFAEFISGRPEIWYATNIEVYDYIDAYNRLQFSVTGDRVHNPTALRLHFATSHSEYSVDPNETIAFI